MADIGAKLRWSSLGEVLEVSIRNDYMKIKIKNQNLLIDRVQWEDQ